MFGRATPSNSFSYNPNSFFSRKRHEELILSPQQELERKLSTQIKDLDSTGAWLDALQKELNKATGKILNQTNECDQIVRDTMKQNASNGHNTMSDSLINTILSYQPFDPAGYEYIQQYKNTISFRECEKRNLKNAIQQTEDELSDFNRPKLSLR